MDTLPAILGPQALGWAAALLTLLTFFSADMRRLRLLALAANAAFILDSSVSHSARRPEPAWNWAARPVFGRR